MKQQTSSKPTTDMDTNGPEDLLKRIARVDPPPFLLTRIEARLSAAVQVPRGRLVAVACALAALLLVNAVVLEARREGAASWMKWPMRWA